MERETPDYTSPEDQHNDDLHETSDAHVDVGQREQHEQQPEHLVPATASDVDATEAGYGAPADDELRDRESDEPAGEPGTIEVNLSPIITLVVGLALGFLVGFVGRPRLISQPQLSAAATPVPATPGPATPDSGEQASVTQPSPAETPQGAAQAPSTATPARGSETSAEDTAANEAAEREAALQQVMQTLISQARHFKGDPDAPVTILEFSDFQ